MSSIEEWYQVAKSKEVDWQKPQDVVDTFGAKRVDILKNDRVCIDIAGNHIRVILKINFGWSTAYVSWIGWHKDYDQLGDDIHTL